MEVPEDAGQATTEVTMCWVGFRSGQPSIDVGRVKFCQSKQVYLLFLCSCRLYVTLFIYLFIFPFS